MAENQEAKPVLSELQIADLVWQAETRLNKLRQEIANGAGTRVTAEVLAGWTGEMRFIEVARDCWWMLIGDDRLVNTFPPGVFLREIRESCGTEFQVRDERAILEEHREKIRQREALREVVRSRYGENFQI